ncbi:hypothetical protein E4T42_07585 [Aureobasidium subglaciale]|nr:hypothetical protein E4T38_07816 [Aureobasidium subglaciale]KAI5216643.1 hypothetical protein E4T40_07826 [Aureobasidium subglaciale]KAI5219957.1 hypothetical protein E4T41_07741 [Aureobasidium subglaciale]KAI5242766.1 hypothetical protein E4T42_07585 [Aureobasidium subglaciale]KAI5257779.1 hypothetical protein E4T46_07717 [Aureobasidium subglaciale]
MRATRPTSSSTPFHMRPRKYLSPWHYGHPPQTKRPLTKVLLVLYWLSKKLLVVSSIIVGSVSHRDG